VSLALGVNSITVRCTNEVGTDQKSVVVTRVAIVDPTPPSPLAVSISTVSPSRFRPLKKGNVFSRKLVKGGARVRVTLSAAANVRVRLEQLEARRRTHSGWSDFELPAGTSTLQLSGRTSKRALAVGRYRIRLVVRGTSAKYFSRSFRIVR
jgi:hypothetical protein